MDRVNWTKEQLENFFRHETQWGDEACKKIASKLAKNGILNLLLKSNPEAYTVRHE